MQEKVIPIDVVDLLPVLDEKLIALLKSLTPEEWDKQTVAKLWKVKDVVAHLLDGNIRVLSALRDGHFDEQVSISSHQQLVDYLNGLNADWVKAMKRVSPQMLIALHEATGNSFYKYYKSIDPFADAVWSVAWVGDTVSQNWKHIAREYTEKWLHQQQIRAAVDKPGLMTKELIYPFMDIFMLGLPHTYRDVVAEEGTTVQIIITTDIGGDWFLIRSNEAWIVEKKNSNTPDAVVKIHPDIAWRLFSKSIRPKEILDQIEFSGNKELAMPALSMVSVMA